MAYPSGHILHKSHLLCNYYIASSSHVAFHDSDTNRIFCARCFDNVAANSPICKDWLKGCCSKFGHTEDRPVPIKSVVVQIGNLSSHRTHSLYHYKGVTYCNRCGYYGLQRMIGLTRPCEAPKPGSHGAASIRAFQAGICPPGLSSWPVSIADRLGLYSSELETFQTDAETRSFCNQTQ